jgi:hypothetical protein
VRLEQPHLDVAGGIENRLAKMLLFDPLVPRRSQKAGTPLVDSCARRNWNCDRESIALQIDAFCCTLARRAWQLAGYDIRTWKGANQGRWNHNFSPK